MFKVGDKVKILSKSSGNYSLEEMKREKDCPDLNCATIKEIRNDGVILIDNNYQFLAKDLELVNSSNQNVMSNVLDFFRNLTATEDEKLLKEYGLENPIGTPTAEGLVLSAELSYKANRKDIIEIAKKMKAEDDKKKE